MRGFGTTLSTCRVHGKGKSKEVKTLFVALTRDALIYRLVTEIGQFLA